MEPARITSFLVKVASRCNLDCDYCYVFHHADQSWRAMPRLLSVEDRAAFAARLAEYCASARIDRASVILHGGEPLLAGAEQMRAFARDLRCACGPAVRLDVGLQTNGLLLDEAALDVLAAENIAVSLSLDGPKAANDRHRTSRHGRSSHAKVEAALDRLKGRPEIFAGVIAVIDAENDPAELLAYFAKHAPPRLDFLLPDSHHMRPPPGRDRDPDVYVRWLTHAFDEWLDHYPELRIRTFEALLDTIAGLPSGTDAFGLGDVSLVSVETDGTYHDLDVLKVVGDGATVLGGSVRDTPIVDVARSAALERHRRLLTLDGLSTQCRGCDIVEICGGGAVPHRHAENGLENPTVYCREMKALVAHARRRLAEQLGRSAEGADLPGFDLESWELAESGAAAMALLRDSADQDHLSRFDRALAAVVRGGGGYGRTAGEILAGARAVRLGLARRPGSVAWANLMCDMDDGVAVTDVDGVPLTRDVEYVATLARAAGGTTSLPEVHVDDPWLRRPFGTGIAFEPRDVAEAAMPLVGEALRLIEGWRPALAAEIRETSPCVQFVRDPSAHPDKIVSFSDNVVPGALYVSVTQSDGLIDAFDLADSIIHEHRHQKLYLLERNWPTTHAGALVVSPWREDLRPASGLLHAIWVFVELRRFWEHVLTGGPDRLRARALNQLADTDRNLQEAFETIRSCDLTATGEALVGLLEGRCSARLAA